jgi:hypothetical protein
MRTILPLVVVMLALVWAVLRALAVDEAKGRIARRLEADVERTISSLPPELQEDWADEWRAEFAAVASMPFSAFRLAQGLRRSAEVLREQTEPALPRMERRAERGPEAAEGSRRSAGDQLRFGARMRIRIGRISLAARRVTSVGRQTPRLGASLGRWYIRVARRARDAALRRWTRERAALVVIAFGIWSVAYALASRGEYFGAMLVLGVIVALLLLAGRRRTS